MLSKFVSTFVELCDHPSDVVAKAAADSISNLIFVYEELTALDRTIVPSVVSALSDKIVNLVKNNKNQGFRY